VLAEYTDARAGGQALRRQRDQAPPHRLRCLPSVQLASEAGQLSPGIEHVQAGVAVGNDPQQSEIKRLGLGKPAKRVRTQSTEPIE
jgi:hypothetical protein